MYNFVTAPCQITSLAEGSSWPRGFFRSEMKVREVSGSL